MSAGSAGAAAAGGATAPLQFITPSTPVRTLINHPAFAGFGVHLLPRPQDAQSTLTPGEAGGLMPWHSHVQPRDIVHSLNRMLADPGAGRQVFYSFYEDADKQAQTGLFYFRGTPGAPFAVICPGAVLSMCAPCMKASRWLMPQAPKATMPLSSSTAPGGERPACEDPAAAPGWIFAHAAEPGPGTAAYSLWGGSAGARMAARPGSEGSAAYGGVPLPRPAAVIMACTGHEDCVPDDVPAFAVASADDPIADPGSPARRTAALKHYGIPVEFRLYRHAGHGFGPDTGTDAEGWINAAADFREQRRRRAP